MKLKRQCCIAISGSGDRRAYGDRCSKLARQHSRFCGEHKDSRR